MSHEELVTMLRENGLSVSHQRLMILDYLMQNRNHPTVEMIYTGLKQSGHPTLSRATVYNNIRAFVDCGLIHELKMGDSERRYDIDLEEHSHFHCRSCGLILNLDLSSALLEELDKSFQVYAPDCVLEKHSVDFSGLCGDCKKASQKENFS